MAGISGGRRFIAAACLGAVVMFASGAIVGLIVAPEPLPASLAAAPAVKTAPATYEKFNDDRQLPFVAVPGESSVVRLAASGTLTSVDCKVGGSLSSGDVPLSIDSRPIPAFYTKYPLWRNVRSGDKGPDVVAVQAELRRLGYKAGHSGVMDRATSKALVAFFKDRGDAASNGSLELPAILRLPSPHVVVADCALRLAEAVGDGDAFATSGGGLIALRPALEADGLAPGARTVVLGDANALVDPDGQVTDPAFLAAVAASPEYALALAQTPQGAAAQVTLETVLAAPLDVAVVPAGSLFRVSGTSGCISSDGVGLPVTVISSRLGSTYVVIGDGSAPTTVDLQAPADRTGKAGTCA